MTRPRTRPRLVRTATAVVFAVGLLGSAGVADAAGGKGGGNGWSTAGGDLQNTRFQKTERAISPASVGGLTTSWAFTTEGDVSATPAVDDTAVYFPDWKGNLYAVDRVTGGLIWSTKISNATGIPGDKARATPAITDDKLIIGDQGPFGGGQYVMAYDKATGALLWRTKVDDHPAAIITQSATVFDGRVYVGVASLEEALAAFIPGYECCSFRGSMLALDLNTGAIVWKTYLAPEGYSGNAVWGSSPAIDPGRGQLYIATGNNYSVPESVLDCVAAAGEDLDAQSACIDPANHFDAVLALDLKTGAIRWVTRAIAFDAWTLGCILGGQNCPEPAGPDYDFGQAPALFTAKGPNGKPFELVGAGQKSGQYWALDPSTGAVKWVTQAGPGGVAGGLQWGSAVDGQRVYTANANSNLVPWDDNGTPVTTGMWSALDAATGRQLWKQSPTHGGGTSGPVTTANGVVFGCSLDPDGYMYAMNAATGAFLWEFKSGGSCLSGAAISKGEVFWGSGYTNLGGTPNNKLYKFGL